MTIMEKETQGIMNVEFLEIRDLSPTTKSFKIARPKEFGFVAGQFLSLMVPQSDRKRPLARSYTIASLPEEKDSLELCVNRVIEGVGTGWLFSRREGDRVEFKGPYGNFILGNHSADGRASFIGMGTGAAPFRPMIRALLKKGHSGKVRLFCGVKNLRERLYFEEWLALRHAFPNFQFHFAISRPEQGDAHVKEAHVQDFLTPEHFGDFSGDYYICGLGEMVKDVREKLKERGVERSKLHYERYS